MQSFWRVGVLWLVWAMAAAASPAQNIGADSSSEMIVVDARWYGYSPETTYHRDFSLSNYPRQTDGYYLQKETVDSYSQGLSNIFALSRSSEKQYVYQVKVRNAGEKEIVAIDWAYIFADPDTEKIIARHSFRTREQIRPRKSRTLSETSVSPPTRVASLQALKKNRYTLSPRTQ